MNEWGSDQQLKAKMKRSIDSREHPLKAMVRSVLSRGFPWQNNKLPVYTTVVKLKMKTQEKANVHIMYYPWYNTRRPMR